METVINICGFYIQITNVDCIDFNNNQSRMCREEVYFIFNITDKINDSEEGLLYFAKNKKLYNAFNDELIDYPEYKINIEYKDKHINTMLSNIDHILLDIIKNIILDEDEDEDEDNKIITCKECKTLISQSTRLYDYAKKTIVATTCIEEIPINCKLCKNEAWVYACIRCKSPSCHCGCPCGCKCD